MSQNVKKRVFIIFFFRFYDKLIIKNVPNNELLYKNLFCPFISATVPDLYALLVELHGVSSLLELLSHQNTDISVAVVDLLQEMTDVDILHESLDGAEVLIEALRKQQASALLVQNLDRLDETVKEEADGQCQFF